MPVADASPARIKALIASLGSEEFAERENGTRELEMLGRLAEPAIREALKAPQSAEQASRLVDILRKVSYPVPTAEELRAIRAVEALERIGEVWRIGGRQWLGMAA